MKTILSLFILVLAFTFTTPAQDLNAIFERGSKNLESGKYEDCVSDFKSYLAQRPNTAEANYNLGVCYSYLDKHLDAVGAFREAVRIKPDYYKAYVQLGNELDLAKSYNEAVIAYNQAIKLEPNNSSAYFELGVAQNGAENYAQAVLSYKKAIQLEPENVNAIYGLGLVYYNQKNKVGLKGQIDALTPLDAEKTAKLKDFLNKLAPMPPGIVKIPAVKSAQRIKDEKDVAAMKDFGFDGALVTEAASIRQTASKIGKLLLTVKRNDILSLVARNDSNGFYRVVDEKSGEEGWIDGSSVVIKLTGNTADTGPPITDNGAGASLAADPVVSITNGETATTLKIRLNGTLYQIPPQSTKLVTVKAGKFTYYGWSPGIRATTGKATLEKGRKYSWSFKIYTR